MYLFHIVWHSLDFWQTKDAIYDRLVTHARVDPRTICLLKSKIDKNEQSVGSNQMKQNLTKEGIEHYSSKLALLSEDYFHLLSPWQRKFIQDVHEQFLVNPKLSKKQMDQIDSIHARVEDY